MRTKRSINEMRGKRPFKFSAKVQLLVFLIFSKVMYMPEFR